MYFDSPLTFNVKSIGECWIKSMNTVLNEGNEVLDDDKKLIERCNICISISSLESIDEIIEKYADKERIALMIKKYNSCSILNQYKISYGKFLYDYDGINQIDWLKKKLKNRSFTKSATIALHPPGNDILSCLSMIDLKLRDHKLNMNCVYRSQNIFASQPGNLIVMKDILKDISEYLNVELGNIYLYIFSAHIYEENIEQAKSIIKRIYANKCN